MVQHYTYNLVVSNSSGHALKWIPGKQSKVQRVRQLVQGEKVINIARKGATNEEARVREE